MKVGGLTGLVDFLPFFFFFFSQIERVGVFQAKISVAISRFPPLLPPSFSDGRPGPRKPL